MHHSFCIEVLKCEIFSGIQHYPFHYCLAGNRREIWDIVVHAACRLGTENTTTMEISAFVNIHDIRIVRIEYEMCPADLVPSSSPAFSIVIPGFFHRHPRLDRGSVPTRCPIGSGMTREGKKSLPERHSRKAFNINQVQTTGWRSGLLPWLPPLQNPPYCLRKGFRAKN